MRVEFFGFCFSVAMGLGFWWGLLLQEQERYPSPSLREREGVAAVARLSDRPQNTPSLSHSEGQGGGGGPWRF